MESFLISPLVSTTPIPRVLEDGVGVAIALKKYLLRKCRPGN
jgi:hypothetical protein